MITGKLTQASRLGQTRLVTTWFKTVRCQRKIIASNLFTSSQK